LKKTEQNFRRIKEELEVAKKEVVTSPAFIIVELSQLLTSEEVNLKKIFLENEKLEKDIYQLKLKLLREKISFIEPRVQFDTEELQDQILKIEKDIIKLQNDLGKAKTKEEFANSRWLNAKEHLVDKTLSPSEAEKKEKEIVNWKIWDDIHHLDVEILSQKIKYLDDSKKIWQYRYALFHKTKSVDLAGWKKEAEQTLDQLEREKRLLIARQTDCLNEILSLEKELESAKEASKTTWYIEEQLKAFKTKENLLKKGLESIQSTQREFQKLKNDIAREEQHKSIKERLSNLLIIARQVGQYEITSIEDNPITVRKVILALALLIAGFSFSHRLTAQIGKQLIKRVGLNEAAAFALQQIMHYLVLVLLVLFVLNYVRIPLTFFTLIGGALAIGVGFGSQNIVNNFLSGLILMVERPIKIGDLVEVENVLGTVEWVGARSTRIKTTDNLRLVVPNSTLLQNKVVNWSLTDDIVRRTIGVGVQYGSPVRKVESLLQQAVNDHNLVEKNPKPIVLFEDFGNNALIFTAIIWIRLSRTGRAHLYIRQVESDIRFLIDELFRQNDIVIAFPQRDIHIDTLKPLEVRIKQE
jgi:small-conductance mechanosensitive channel